MGFWDSKKKKIVNEEVEAEEVEEEDDEEEEYDTFYLYIYCDGEADGDSLTKEFDNRSERDKVFAKVKEDLKTDLEWIEIEGDWIYVKKIKYILAREE